MLRAALLACLALAACAPSAAEAPISEQWRALTLETRPAELGAENVGRLRFRGGVVLSSPESEAFGGLSGLEVLEDGRLIAVSDNGLWFEARLTLDAEGALAGLEDARVALMRDENGEPFENKRSGDAEGLTQLPDGRFAVSFEQTQSIRIYDINRDGPFGVARPGPALEGARRLPANSGLEALTASEAGALIVGAQGGSRADTPLWRAPLDAASPAPIAARYPLQTGYALTGLDRLPDGRFVALERFYAPIIGVRVRITRFALSEGAIAPEELAFFAPPLWLDNFEGIAAVRAPDGGVRLYIVSDNNFSARQSTLLYAFDIVE